MCSIGKRAHAPTWSTPRPLKIELNRPPIVALQNDGAAVDLGAPEGHHVAVWGPDPAGGGVKVEWFRDYLGRLVWTQVCVSALTPRRAGLPARVTAEMSEESGLCIGVGVVCHRQRRSEHA